MIWLSIICIHTSRASGTVGQKETTRKCEKYIWNCKSRLNKLCCYFCLIPTVSLCMERDIWAPLTPFPGMLTCSTSYHRCVCPIWYQVIQNCKIEADSTLGTQYGHASCPYSITYRILKKNDCTLKTLQTYHPHCFVNSLWYLFHYCHCEIAIVLGMWYWDYCIVEPSIPTPDWHFWNSQLKCSLSLEQTCALKQKTNNNQQNSIIKKRYS